jgi:hypothetical protein
MVRNIALLSAAVRITRSSIIKTVVVEEAVPDEQPDRVRGEVP